MIYDVCIIGGGPAGLAVADALTSSSNIKLVVLEAGGETTPNTDASDFVTKGETWYKPIRQFMLGGHGHLWGGACPRLHPADFRMNSLFGMYVDWPIIYEELVPYYEKAERLLSVLHRMGTDEQYQNDPVLHELHRRDLAGDIPYGNRLYFVDELVPKLHKRGVEIRTSSVVQSIRESDTSPTLVAYSDDKSLELKKVQARIVVLACGGLSNARIMQLSRSGKFPEGLGNHSGHLGRYMMDHPRNVVSIVRRYDWRSGSVVEGSYPYSFVKPVAVGEPSVAYGTVHMTGRRDVALDIDVLADLFVKINADNFEGAVLDSITSDHAIEFDFECMDPPSSESRIGVAEELDKYGSPKLATYMQLNSQRHASMNQLLTLLKQVFGGLGYEIQLVKSTGMIGQHPSGSTRMAAQPEDGVVDPNLKVFGTKSVYVLGSSVFPTVGYANPTLTIVSLALRLADHISEFRGNGLT